MIGQTLSHYEIRGKIGEGGMGVVYRAIDTRLQREVALKFLRPDLTGDARARERFLGEARAAAALDHPRICTVYEIDEAEGQIFIAMAFIEGQSLRQHIGRRPLAIDEAVRIATQIAEGLMAAHARGIVHRDVKPANVMLTPERQTKIMDFGLARLTHAAELTATGTVMGTPAYMSPEQARGDRVDHRTDIWSLGCVLYEMLTGRPPFESHSALAVLHAVVHDDPPPLAAFREDVPAGLATIVQRCLQKDPLKRYDDLSSVLSDVAVMDRVNGGVPGPSIAVLPFVDMSAAKDQEYFCDGIAEELINALTHIRNLRVVARTSAFAFKAQNLDVREIGRRLNVGAVLEGSIRKAGSRLRITAQLIEVQRGYHLWSEKFDREMKDIFAIQDEVSAAVVDSLKGELLPAEKKLLARRRTTDPETYNLYLKGLHFSWKPEGLAKALEYFQSATDRDPTFAPAHVGTASTYGTMATLSIAAPKQAWSRAKAALDAALALDDSLAEAHAQAGVRALYYDWDWKQAEQSLQRALTLNPGLAPTHAWIAWLSVTRGRFDEAIAEIRRAQQLDPLMAPFYAMGVCIYRLVGRFDEALAEFERATELDPSPGVAHFHLAGVYYDNGMLDEAEAMVKRLPPGALSGWGEMFLGLVHVARGRRADAAAMLRSTVEKRRVAYVSPWCIAALAAAVGEIDQAFQYLEVAYEERDSLMPFLNVLPEVAALRSDPRFQVLLERMDLATPSARGATA